MTPSTTKSSCKLLCIHPVPAHVSTREYAVKLETALDAVLSTPICRENFLNYEIMIPNDRLDSHFKALGFEAPQPVIITKSECKTADHVVQILEDAEVIKLVSGQEFLDTSVFTVDETIRLDAQSSNTCDGSYMIALVCPPNLSAAELQEKCNKLGDEIVQLPTIQKNAVKHTMWVKNEALAPHVQPLGMFSAEPLVVGMLQSTLDGMSEILADSGVKQFFAGQKTFTNEQISNRFAVDVVVKI